MSTVVVESRCTVIELAKALSFIKSQGYMPRSRAEVVSLCIKAISSLYEGEDMTEEESLSLLREALGTVNLGRSREGRVQIGKALRNNLQTYSINVDKEKVEETKEDLLKKIQGILDKGI